MTGRQVSTRDHSPWRSSPRHIRHHDECRYILGSCSSRDRHFDKTHNIRRSRRETRHLHADLRSIPGHRNQEHRSVPQLHGLGHAANRWETGHLQFLNPSGRLRTPPRECALDRGEDRPAVSLRLRILPVSLLELLYTLRSYRSFMVSHSGLLEPVPSPANRRSQSTPAWCFSSSQKMQYAVQIDGIWCDLFQSLEKTRDATSSSSVQVDGEMSPEFARLDTCAVT